MMMVMMVMIVMMVMMMVMMITMMVVAGGVARNKYLRTNRDSICDQYNVKLVCPPPSLCTDNGVMVAWAAIERINAGLFLEEGEDVNESLECFAKLPLDSEMKIIDTSSNLYQKMKRLT